MSAPLKLHLAPMEGVVDWIVRDTLTSIGGIDQCVTEFIRVTDNLHGDKIFYEYCPELKTGSKTRSGVPVAVQLLGGKPEPLAANAFRAYELGACAIDLNFGCPAKTVNRHDGGAALLKTPERIYQILKTVRTAVPTHIPVSAKMRLGFDNPNGCIDIAKAVEDAGITTLTVHCRTKTDMYKPPAFWEWIPKIKAATKLNIIANGDIWSADDLFRCQAETGCNEFMIGRGALSNPFLFREIKDGIREKKSNWNEIKKLLPPLYDTSETQVNKLFAVARTKQWLAQISKRNNDARLVFDEMKIIMEPTHFVEKLKSHCLNELANTTQQNA